MGMAASDMQPAPTSDPLKLDRCPRCGYSLQELHDEGLCPECGLPYGRYEVVLYSRTPKMPTGPLYDLLVPTLAAGVVGLVLLGEGQPWLAGCVGGGFWLLIMLFNVFKQAPGSPVRLLLGPQGFAQCLPNGRSMARPWSPYLGVQMENIDAKVFRLAIVTTPRFQSTPIMPYPVQSRDMPGDVDLVVECNPDRARQIHDQILSWCAGAERPAACEPDAQAPPPCLPARQWTSSRGVLLSLDEGQVARLRAFEDENDRVDDLQAEIQEGYFQEHPEHVAETDQAWDPIHRCLTDGRLGLDNGQFPLSHAILGGEQLYQGEDYILSVKTPEQVVAIAEALAGVPEELVLANYDRIDAADYERPLSAQDRLNTQGWLEEVVAFYQNAAAERRFVIFTFHQ